MTPQELLAAAEAGTLNLDLEENTLQGPEQTAQQDAAPTAPAAPAAVTEENAEAVAPIASKSGAYTIPYEQLAKAREQAKAFAAENELLKAQLNAAQAANLAQAQSQAQDRADAGLAATSGDANLEAAQQAVAEGVDPAIFGDFSDEGIAKGVKALVTQGVQQAIAPLMQERQAVAQQTAAASHYSAIYDAHQDADELVQSAEFSAWRQSLPGFARAAVERALTEGAANDVVEVFSAFKEATAAPAAGSSKVQQAIANASAATQVPASLSEITGQAASSSAAEQVAALAENPAALMARMSDLTPVQLEKLMNSV